MGVGADYEFAGSDEPFLGQENVLDAHAADFPVVADGVFFGEVAQGFRLFSGLDVLVGGKMVGDEGDFVLVEDRSADFVEFDDRRRAGDVVGKDEVDPAADELAGDDFVEARVAGENFFRHCHTHVIFLLQLARRPGGRRWR
jgi:hypothetical protein